VNRKTQASAHQAELEQLTGNRYANCYQCGKCTAGCPAGDQMDNPPTLIMRLIQLGRLADALRSQSLWCCVACQTCTARCPQNMDIAGTMDALREIALRENIVSETEARKRVNAFHQAFLAQVHKNGRLNELGMVTSYKLRTGTFFQDVDSGVKMVLQGKINPLSLLKSHGKVKAQEQIDRIFAASKSDKTDSHVEKRKPEKIDINVRDPIALDPDKTMGYYPGCSLGGTAIEYGVSVLKMCELLGIRIKEIDDWNCCGGSSAHATGHVLSQLLPARNQVLADAQGFEHVLTPCAACYNRQVITRDALQNRPELREKIEEITGATSSLRAEFVNTMQLLEGYGLEKLAAGAKENHPIKGLKLACYYGCLLVRPQSSTAFDDPEHPTKMDKIVAAVGAEPVDWAFKVECCGAGLTMANPKLIEELTYNIVKNASQAGAQAFVVACPLCHSNLDMRQASMRSRFGDVPTMPVYYISELVALAYGADPRDVAINKHFVPAVQLVTR